MRIFDETKSQELNESELDLDNGYLKPDKLLTAHRDAIPFKPGKTVREIADELITQGVIVEESPVGIFRVVEEYEGGGRRTEEIFAESDTPAKEAWDEYEDIQVYIPYTAKELEEQQLIKLRNRRITECFSYINRGQLWYDSLTYEQRTELQKWYNDWLDVTETMIVPTKPYWLKD